MSGVLNMPAYLTDARHLRQSRDTRQSQSLVHWSVLEALPSLRSPIWPNDDRRMDTARPNGHS